MTDKEAPKVFRYKAVHERLAYHDFEFRGRFYSAAIWRSDVGAKIEFYDRETGYANFAQKVPFDFDDMRVVEALMEAHHHGRMLENEKLQKGLVLAAKEFVTRILQFDEEI